MIPSALVVSLPASESSSHHLEGSADELGRYNGMPRANSVLCRQRAPCFRQTLRLISSQMDSNDPPFRSVISNSNTNRFSPPRGCKCDAGPENVAPGLIVNSTGNSSVKISLAPFRLVT